MKMRIYVQIYHRFNAYHHKADLLPNESILYFFTIPVMTNEKGTFLKRHLFLEA